MPPTHELVLKELVSDGLLLRVWRDEDLNPFAALNADPVVVEHLPGQLSRDESDTMAGRIRAHFAEAWQLPLPSGDGADPRGTPAATARALPPQPMKLDLG